MGPSAFRRILPVTRPDSHTLIDLRRDILGRAAVEERKAVRLAGSLHTLAGLSQARVHGLTWVPLDTERHMQVAGTPLSKTETRHGERLLTVRQRPDRFDLYPEQQFAVGVQGPRLGLFGVGVGINTSYRSRRRLRTSAPGPAVQAVSNANHVGRITARPYARPHGLGNQPDTNNNGGNGYTTSNARLDYSWSLVLQGSVDVAPGCFAPGIAELNFSVKYQCFANGGESEATTPVLEATFRCPDFKSKETITLVHGQIGDSIIGISGTYLKDDGSTTAGPAHFEFGPAETIVINCDNYYPWDVHGPNQSTDLDGIVDLPNDILGVIQHFCPLPTQPCSKANLGK